MKLIPEWQEVVKSAWSFLGSVANAVFLAAAAGWESFAPEDLRLDVQTYLAVGAILAALTGAGRLVQQEKLAQAIASYLNDEAGAVSKKAAGAVLAAVLAISVPFGMKWEGTVLTPYWDKFGKVWTVCTGETAVEMREYTLEECMAMHEKRVAQGYSRLIAAFPLLPSAPVEVQAMAVDLEYNVGIGAVVSSKNTGGALRSGRWRDFCNMLPSWNKSGGKFVQGLLNRRKDAQAICLSGLGD